MEDSAFLVSVKELENLAFKTGQIQERITVNIRRINNLDAVLCAEDFTDEEKDLFISQRISLESVAHALSNEYNECMKERDVLNGKLIEICKVE